MNNTNMGNIDLDELKGKIDEIKLAMENTQQENKGNPKQSFGKKILGIIILIVFVLIVGFIFLSNLDMVILPKNSIKIVVVDEKHNVVEGLRVNIRSYDGRYNKSFTSQPEIIIFDAAAGKYLLTFEVIPGGYDCGGVTNDFMLEQDGKVKLEYKCKIVN